PRADEAGEDLSAESDLMVGSTMNSDLFGGGDARLAWTPDGERILFSAPVEGSYELFTVEPATRRIARLTEDRHYLSRADLAPLAAGRPGAARVAAVRATGSTPPDIVSLDLPAPGGRVDRRPPLRRLTDLMGEAWRGMRLVEPVARWHEVDGRRIQGWYIAPQGTRRGRKAPLVVEIHGGPATLYGWSMFWEWQCLAAQGVGVYACNPRGSQGYGQAFQAANIGDWGEGPMRDVVGGVEALIAEGLADPSRLGVTGGSYGGYLTSWIISQTDRFRAAVTCRSVSDMISQMLSGDIGGATFGRLEYRVQPWEDPLLYLEHSPLRYAERITTPLLIQHSEKDLRTPIGQAEELFSVLRSLRREVRLMRVPEETHELTRSGAPFRRVENLTIILDWFRHYLVEGRRGLPPLPRRAGARSGRPPAGTPQRPSAARSRSNQAKSSSRPRGSR
ncbi:MAG TPA: S9 family peptidase, partial [Candidatus Limnocylindrales bacterium]|nr:S9 family peptidase [Candidatus Limnocylindrales bacterium]